MVMVADMEREFGPSKDETCEDCSKFCVQVYTYKRMRLAIYNDKHTHVFVGLCILTYI